MLTFNINLIGHLAAIVPKYLQIVNNKKEHPNKLFTCKRTLIKAHTTPEVNFIEYFIVLISRGMTQTSDGKNI